ncbi:MAG TPA: diguanylate cyclase [Burkholderiaceae bacterium]|nr:diguanylate cyclase [Burkholderiaceae bacterium]
MGTPTPTPQAPAAIAKAALLRLASAKLEPTPENYARAYAEEAGEPTPAQAWAMLIERIVRGLERGGRQWTAARKKESLQRVLEGSRGDAQRLQQRLRGMLASWDSDNGAEAPLIAGDSALGPGSGPSPAVADASPPPAAPLHPPAAQPVPATSSDRAWQPLVMQLEGTVRSALPADEPRAAELAEELSALADRIASEGPTPHIAAAVEAVCTRARRLLAHRHHLVEGLGALCRELTAGLTELSEDESWARGQCESLQARLAEDLSVRGVRAASEVLAQTRERQHALRSERDRAREALKGLIHRMLHELGELGETTGRFHESVGRHAEVIESADSLESLAGAVREMVEESRAVQALVRQTQTRLHDEHERAGELERKVRELEGELRRLSEEVSTDALTQIANRRGLMQAFEVEQSKLARGAGPLALGLIDIDNFKKLNDSLGHNAGDQALKALAQRVRTSLRPHDSIARFGGEEFVVMLPDTPLEEARLVLTRLQRAVSGSLFMHDEKPVLVTFSAGVTLYRDGERIEQALERADEALYEAKRTGKNRTCVA